LAGALADVTAIRALDSTHVEFALKEPNPEVPSVVSDYHAAILCKSVSDPAAVWVGTGPFALESYAAEDRAISRRTPGYWLKDDQEEEPAHLTRSS
jgi:ABC-type transport system substrate-binding protein